MKLILKKVKKKDNELMRYIIIMCQTYYWLDMNQKNFGILILKKF
jgi:hypothetical protein